MTSPTTNRIPAPVYAVAGAGDLAYQQLRKLPALTAELRRADLPGRVEQRVEQLRTDLPARAAELRAELPGRVAGLRTEIPARVEQLRVDFPAAATRFVSEAYQVYNDLVARGEAVVEARRNGRIVVKATTGTPGREPASASVSATATTTRTRATKTTKPAKKATKSASATAKATKATKATPAKRTRPAQPR